MQLIENIKKDLFNKKYANPIESKNIILSKETRKNSNNSDLITFLNVKENEIIEKIIEPSDKRGEILCDSFLKCGGCAFRHIKYSEELKLKENAVQNNLKRIGGVEPSFEPITALDESGYRNKCQYPVAIDKNGEVLIGFYSEHSHRVVDCPNCALQPMEFSKIVKVFKEFLKENNISIYNEERICLPLL